MNRVKFLMVIGVSSETTTEIALIDWIIGRYAIPIFLIVLCLFWALIGSEDISYEPRHIDLKWNGRKDLVLRFEGSDFVSRSIEEEIWFRGIGRTLEQLEIMRKPSNPLWRDLDSLLDQWEQGLAGFD